MPSNAKVKKDYYKVLCVSADATDDDLRRAYKMLALKWHPDRHCEAADKEVANEKFVEISCAYRALTIQRERARKNERSNGDRTDSGDSPSSTKSAPAAERSPNSPSASRSSSSSHHTSTATQTTPPSSPPSSPPDSGCSDLPESVSHSQGAGKPAPPNLKPTRSKPSLFSSHFRGRTASTSHKPVPSPKATTSKTSSRSRGQSKRDVRSSPRPSLFSALFRDDRKLPPKSKATSGPRDQPQQDPPIPPNSPRSHRDPQDLNPESNTSTKLPPHEPLTEDNPRPSSPVTPSRLRKKSRPSKPNSSRHNRQSTYSRRNSMKGQRKVNPILKTPSTKTSEADGSPPTPPSEVSIKLKYPLKLTLNELFHGTNCTKRITRYLQTKKKQRAAIHIPIPPGCVDGTEIECIGVGNERKNGTCEDIIFVIEQIPHDLFRLEEGGDVIMDVHVPWIDSLKYEIGELCFEGLGGEELCVEIPYLENKALMGEHPIVGAGMPIREGDRIVSRGNLIVRWEIVFNTGQTSKWMSFKRHLGVKI